MTQKSTVARNTTSAVPMTAEQRATFDRDGYLIIRGALRPDEAADAREAIDRVYASMAKAGSLGPDVARFGSLLAVAVLPALAGITGTVYLHADALAAGWTAVLISGALCAVGGLLAAVTITNPCTRAPPRRRCYVRAVPALRPRCASTDNYRRPDSRCRVARLGPERTKAPVAPPLPLQKAAHAAARTSYYTSCPSPSASRTVKPCRPPLGNLAPKPGIFTVSRYHHVLAISPRG